MYANKVDCLRVLLEAGAGTEIAIPVRMRVDIESQSCAVLLSSIVPLPEALVLPSSTTAVCTSDSSSGLFTYCDEVFTKY